LIYIYFLEKKYGKKQPLKKVQAKQIGPKGLSEADWAKICI
jgi:hypothetical protein